MNREELEILVDINRDYQPTLEEAVQQLNESDEDLPWVLPYINNDGKLDYLIPKYV